MYISISKSHHFVSMGFPSTNLRAQSLQTPGDGFMHSAVVREVPGDEPFRISVGQSLDGFFIYCGGENTEEFLWKVVAKWIVSIQFCKCLWSASSMPDSVLGALEIRQPLPSRSLYAAIKEWDFI